MLMEEVAPQEEDGIMMDYGSRSYWDEDIWMKKRWQLNRIF
jgi:hypothetical protein